MARFLLGSPTLLLGFFLLIALMTAEEVETPGLFNRARASSSNISFVNVSMAKVLLRNGELSDFFFELLFDFFFYAFRGLQGYSVRPGECLVL